MGRDQVTVTRGFANNIPLVTVYVFMKSFSKNQLKYNKKVTAYEAKAPTLKTQSDEPSRPITGEGEVSAVYKSTESKES